MEAASIARAKPYPPGARRVARDLQGRPGGFLLGGGEEIAASLFAGRTRLGALLHRLLVGELGALLGAGLAQLGAAFAHQLPARAAPRHDLPGQGADVGAVLADAHRREVLL